MDNPVPEGFTVTETDLARAGNVCECLGLLKENSMGTNHSVFQCPIHPGVYFSKIEPCHLCMAEAMTFRHNQSTSLERLTIALIRAVKDPTLLNSKSVAEIVELAGLFEAALSGRPIPGGKADTSVWDSHARPATVNDLGPEPRPDELPIFDERRVIMTRTQFDGYLLRAIDDSCIWHSSGKTAGQMRATLIAAFERLCRD